MNLMFWRRRDDDEAGTARDRVLEQLSAYLDGELTDAEEAAVEALIARDAAAAEVLGDLRLMRSAFGALGEVRAPRSFAIPADAAPARAAGVPVALFRRTEMFMRASAAVAALLFVVALVNDPGGSTPIASPTSSLAFDSAVTMQAAAENATAPDEAEKGESGDVGAAGLAAPAPTEGGSALVPPDATSEGGAGGGIVESPAGTSMQADGARQTEELRPLEAGTELIDQSSQDAGGMALGLGALAGLLTALSALTAWSRRSDGPAR